MPRFVNYYLHIALLLNILSLPSLLLAKNEPATVSNKECPIGCTKHGNCNGETGECECRFGFGGPDCGQRLMPACHNAPDLNTSLPAYGHFYPKNCHCLKQLARAACPPSYTTDPYSCPYYQFWAWKHTSCYVIKDLPESEQLSLPPDGPTDPRYQWRRGLFNESAVAEGGDPYQFEDAPAAPSPYELPDGTLLLPIDKCPQRCSGRGWCSTVRDRPGEVQCNCQGFYGGSSCEQPQGQHCYLNCSGRGECHGGYCHCQPGYWGLGCGRSRAYRGESWLPHPTKLRVYVYDLPEHVAYKRPWHDPPALLDTMYLAEVSFMESLLGDWGVRTENPWEANLFVINAYTIYYTGNIGFPGKHFSSVFSYVRSRYPFWNMTGGRNHVAVATNDRGCCDLYKLGKPELQNPIKLVHFAQVGRHGRTGHGHSDPALEAAAREFRRLGGGGHHHSGGVEEEDGMLGQQGGAAAAAAEGQEDMGGERVRFRGLPAFNLESLRMEREPCFRPEQDVAIPNYLNRGWLQHLNQSYQYPEQPGGRVLHRKRERPYLFYFHGYSKPDMAYSGGVRQGLLALFGNTTRPDVAINKGITGADAMLSSRFCLAPLGYGWGIRLTQAMHTGCVPVIVQDHTYSAFWDVVPYEKFAVRINRHNLHRLFDLLDAVTPEQLEELQQGLADYHKYFIWHTDVGGLAYNTTLTSLHRRLTNMWSALFRGTS
ncbi:hypothetical protein Agub_g2319 [Astrephomene gubernaculifera]|uniref:EGF-like domain-containing protein n=1 Tax=Astrephomene gubernaculifera TaxID=47775 RepID=A0AAD3DGY0_9CHLO|nr:hypothetical protein Agub_g2319 [Astrephomene gubernaculifera]